MDGQASGCRLDPGYEALRELAFPEMARHIGGDPVPEVLADFGMDPFIPQDDKPFSGRHDEEEDPVPQARIGHPQAPEGAFGLGTHPAPKEVRHGYADFSGGPFFRLDYCFPNPLFINELEKPAAMHDRHNDLSLPATRGAAAAGATSAAAEPASSTAAAPSAKTSTAATPAAPSAETSAAGAPAAKNIDKKPEGQ